MLPRSLHPRFPAALLLALLAALFFVHPSEANRKVAKKASTSQASYAPVLVGPRSDPRKALAKRQLTSKRTPHRTALLARKPSALVIGVMGGAGAVTPPNIAEKVAHLGAAIASQLGIVLTGAAPGLPDIAATAAKAKGAYTIGISPYRTMLQHKRAKAPVNFDVIKLTSHPALHGQDRPNYMGREIDNIEHSDAIVIVGGRFGTLGEFAIAADERRPIGVLTGSGGIADTIKQIVEASTKAGKPPGAPIIYDSNPKRLITRLIKATRAFQASGESGPLGDGDKAKQVKLPGNL
ncbi:MAG: hypothetical protein IPL79_16930 [Myxococcales bacterium]|nr:hypothetical protein [Myxococcales bacterium]